MVLCQGAGRQKEEICFLLLLSSGSDAHQAAWEGSGFGIWAFLLSIHPCLWSVKDVYGAFAFSLHWCLIRPGEKGRGVKPMMPALEFRRTGGQLSHSWRQSEHAWAGLHHSPTLGPQEFAQAWVAPVVLTLFNNDLSYQCCHDFGESPLWIILLNYGWMSAAEAYYP